MRLVRPCPHPGTKCCNPNDSDDFDIQGLTSGGGSIVVTGAKNQVCIIAGVVIKNLFTLDR